MDDIAQTFFTSYSNSALLINRPVYLLSWVVAMTGEGLAFLVVLWNFTEKAYLAVYCVNTYMYMWYIYVCADDWLMYPIRYCHHVVRLKWTILGETLC